MRLAVAIGCGLMLGGAIMVAPVAFASDGASEARAADWTPTPAEAKPVDLKVHGHKVGLTYALRD
jgi:hypothetical protein